MGIDNSRNKINNFVSKIAPVNKVCKQKRTSEASSV